MLGSGYLPGCLSRLCGTARHRLAGEAGRPGHVKSPRTKTPDDNNMRLCGFAALDHQFLSSSSPRRSRGIDTTAAVRICIPAHPGTYQTMRHGLYMGSRHGRLPGVAGPSHAVSAAGVCLAGGSGTEYARNAAFDQPSCLLRHAGYACCAGYSRTSFVRRANDGKFHCG